MIALRWIGRNLSTFLVAFALALAVWVAVVINSDPNQECSAPRLVPIEVIGDDPGLKIMEELPSQGRIQIYAPRTICEQMASEEGAVQVLLDLSGLGPGEHTVPVDPEISDRFQPFRILSYSPQELEVTLEPLVTLKFPLEFEVLGEPALGFSAEDPVMEVEEVTVSGPESLVSQVDRIEGRLNISGARQTVQTSAPLQPLDALGAVVNGVAVTPGRTDVFVQITQLGGYRDVAVKVKTGGQWATGFRLTNISVSPPTVTVFSTDPQRVNDLPGFVETTAVDLEGADDDLEARVALDLPSGITLVGGQATVLVQVSIAAIESNLTVSLPVEIIGLAPGLEARIAPESVDVILFGPVPVLEILTPETVRVVVDLTDLTAGSHQLTPFVDILPDPVQEQGINPVTVEVVLTLLATSTPATTSASPSPTP